MSQTIIDPGADPTPAESPLNVDAAVRAALSQHAKALRTFANEDDMEGPRAGALASAPSA